jgi:hypothetical protein
MRQLDARSRDIAKHAEALHLLSRSRDGEVTLAGGSATTIVTDPTVTPDTVFVFDALTASAAAELAAGTLYVLPGDRRLGSFTITHVNSAVADRAFRWAALGD